jgi:hypothetical protein
MFTVLAIVAIGALGAAGCGDDDDEQTLTGGATGATGASGETTTKAAFIEAADEVCSAANKELQEDIRGAFPNGPPEGGDDAVAFIEDIVLPNLQAQHDAIAELPPPAGREEELEDLLATLQEGIDTASDNPQTMIDGDPLADAADAAEELGLQSCGG